jgi:hypothetical protein
MSDRLIQFCQALEESSNDALRALDRETLLEAHRALCALKIEIEEILVHASFNLAALN